MSLPWPPTFVGSWISKKRRIRSAALVSDVGDQYRSQIWTTTPEQLRDSTALREAYQDVLSARGFGPIQTVLSAAPGADSNARFWYAEDYHQQYLFKNPGGYECHARTGVACPALPSE